mmetsp:Transcript_83441/g.131408  ORF Transcript_83441/g.131408 Transcript_83441/m.131408 type:complete len:134 (-) Transcript_83441:283-684(-)
MWSAKTTCNNCGLDVQTTRICASCASSVCETCMPLSATDCFGCQLHLPALRVDISHHDISCHHENQPHGVTSAANSRVNSLVKHLFIEDEKGSEKRGRQRKRMYTESRGADIQTYPSALRLLWIPQLRDVMRY